MTFSCPRALLLFVTSGLLLACFALPTAASAASVPIVGIGEQRPDKMLGPLFAQTTIKQLRVTVPWDASSTAEGSAALDRQFAAFRQLGLDPLVSFGRSWKTVDPGPLMSVVNYAKMFRDFHRRFPWVTQFASWNEVNACASQPTCHAPQRVAAYYRTIRKQCPKCTTLVATLLDSSQMVSYVTRLKRHVGNDRKLIWGLHNYGDASGRRNFFTRQLAASVRGQLWLTETGALARYRGPNEYLRKRPSSEALQSKSVRYVLGPLLKREPRIKRIYIYQWMGVVDGWDSGLVRPDGSARPALRDVMQALAAGRVRTR